MNAFFSPKSRIRTSRVLAVCMNTLNLLGPALLLCAVTLAVFARFSDQLPEQRQVLLIAATLLVAASLAIRVIWGIGVRQIAAKVRREAEDAPASPTGTQ